MIAYQVTMTTILALGLVQQAKSFRLQVLYGQSKKLLGLFVFGIFVSVGMIVWSQGQDPVRVGSSASRRSRMNGRISSRVR